jgi:NhaA family Na+:H+ antiporter
MGVALPEGIGWPSLFICELAFSDGALVNTDKLGILAASLISGVAGWTLLRRATSLNPPG